MKSIITILFALFISISNFAQQGINYKALIKDSSGNVLTSAPVSIQFIIYEGVALTNNVYQESHTVNTDANGIVIVNIGQGTTSDVFANINWGIDQHFLNVQINTGSGLVDMGTTEFKTVPYALSAANVTGLKKITENTQTGWRLKGAIAANYGNIGSNAVDLSISDAASTHGALGNDATAMGYNTTASAFASTAMGNGTTASGNNATAMGQTTEASGFGATAMGNGTIASGSSTIAMGSGTKASGNFSTAMGSTTIASGYYTTAMGILTNAHSYGSLAMGRYNIGGGNTTTWTATDPLFEIGNGADASNLSNALTVLKNGTITAPSFDLSEITDNKALITKEYADALTPYNGKQHNFISPGIQTFTVPTGVTRIYYEIAGGGGGYGGTYEGSPTFYGGGGGGSGSFLFGFLDVTQGEILTVEVGSRGFKGTNGTSPTDGTTGGATVISNNPVTINYIIAEGGKGGKAGSSSSPGNGGFGGVASVLYSPKAKGLTPLRVGVGDSGTSLDTSNTFFSHALTGVGGVPGNMGQFNGYFNSQSPEIISGFTAGPGILNMVVIRPYYAAGLGLSQHVGGDGYAVLYW